jgi:hypothetical protein
LHSPGIIQKDSQIQKGPTVPEQIEIERERERKGDGKGQVTSTLASTAVLFERERNKQTAHNLIN